MYQHSVMAERFVLGLNFVFHLIHTSVFKEIKYMYQWNFNTVCQKVYCLNNELKPPILDHKNYLLVQFMTGSPWPVSNTITHNGATHLTFLDFMIIHFCQLTNKTQHLLGLKRQSNDETMLLSTGGGMVS